MQIQQIYKGFFPNIRFMYICEKFINKKNKKKRID